MHESTRLASGFRQHACCQYLTTLSLIISGFYERICCLHRPPEVNNFAYQQSLANVADHSPMDPRKSALQPNADVQDTSLISNLSREHGSSNSQVLPTWHLSLAAASVGACHDSSLGRGIEDATTNGHESEQPTVTSAVHNQAVPESAPAAVALNQDHKPHTASRPYTSHSTFTSAEGHDTIIDSRSLGVPAHSSSSSAISDEGHGSTNPRRPESDTISAISGMLPTSGTPAQPPAWQASFPEAATPEAHGSALELNEERRTAILGMSSHRLFVIVRFAASLASTTI